MADLPEFKPIIVNSVTYIGTLFTFYLVYFIPVPLLPYPLEGGLIESNDEHFAQKEELRIAFVIMWSLHFFRRTVEVLFVHIYRRRMPFIESIGAPIYYWFFAVFIAWSVNKDRYLMPPSWLFILGILIFALGEIGNCWCHWQLRQLRTRATTNDDVTLMISGRVMPSGFLFNLVSCPHYLCEIITWFGFALATVTLASFSFLVCTLLTLIVYGRRSHLRYKEYFDGEEGRTIYPSKRKALFPFIF